MQQLDVYYQHFLNMFRASLCPSSGEQYVCYCTLLQVTVRPSQCSHLIRQRPTTATNHNQQNQHTTCSNIRIVLLKMGIMMPETC